MEPRKAAVGAYLNGAEVSGIRLGAPLLPEVPSKVAECKFFRFRYQKEGKEKKSFTFPAAVGVRFSIVCGEKKKLLCASAIVSRPWPDLRSHSRPEKSRLLRRIVDKVYFFSPV